MRGGGWHGRGVAWHGGGQARLGSGVGVAWCGPEWANGTNK